ncbi:MAG: RNA polymerase sigma factor [Bacteroidota bacterium]
MTEAEIIQGCKSGDRRAQKALYDRYAPKMLGIVRRYVSRLDEAEDLLVEGLFKALDKIDSYQEQGSFEGWIRRIVVNEALMYLRKNFALKQAADLSDINPSAFSIRPRAAEDLAAQDILDLLDQLPTGYRTVFNLYVIEGYKHREIAELMGVSINTSKSQLILAKQRLRKLLKAINYPTAAYERLKTGSQTTK